jgi:hypothetical protein
MQALMANAEPSRSAWVRSSATLVAHAGQDQEAQRTMERPGSMNSVASPTRCSRARRCRGSASADGEAW